MTTIVQEIAKWVSEVNFDKIPRSVIEKTKYQILNIVAAAHAGSKSPAAGRLLDAVRKWDLEGDSFVVSTDRKFSRRSALFANTALSMAHDYDDYLFLGHSGHSAVFASLIVGLAEKKSMKEILTAIAIGNEIAGRLGAACLIGPQNGQMWTHIHIGATAAISAKLMGLNEQATAHAIAIGYYQPPFAMPPGFMGPDTKILSAAQTSLAGLTAAELAHEGFTGPLDIFENRQGFLNQFSYLPLDFMLTGWGKSWVTESLAYKLVPGCAYIDTCVDAVKKILEDFRAKNGRDISTQDVREIEVRASLLTIGMDKMSQEHVSRGDLNPIAINFSIPANVAILIMTGELRVENLDPDWLDLHREDILALMRRIKLSHDWEMSLGVLEAMDKTLNFGKIVDEVGLANLLRARSQALEHFGIGVSLGLKDVLEMREQAGEKGKQYFSKMISSAWKKIMGAPSRSRERKPIDLGDIDFTKFRMPFAAEVTVRTVDWKEYTARQDIPFGSPGQPWSDTAARIKHKFSTECAKGLSKKQIDWVLEKVDIMENIPDPAELIRNITRGANFVAAPPKKIEISKPAPAPAPKPVDTPAPVAAKPPVATPAPVTYKPPVAAAAPIPGKPRIEAAPVPKPHIESEKPVKKHEHPPIDLDLPPVEFKPIAEKPVERVKYQKPERAGRPEPSERAQREERFEGTGRPQRQERPERKEQAPRPAAPPRQQNQRPQPKAKRESVSMRPAARGEKSPRPPKGAKRKRLNRP